MLIGFFRSIPRDIDEAAMIDGATYLEAFRRIILPLAPGSRRGRPFSPSWQVEGHTLIQLRFNSRIASFSAVASCALASEARPKRANSSPSATRVRHVSSTARLASK